MELTKVESSTIAGIGYYGSGKIMTVKFNSGTFYNYFDISLEEYERILNAKSIGSKLREVVTNKQYKKVI